ncbi:unnamed protein product [Closterium sp. NIES-65]|nr:unnamed protein product [Closterium sp. NIES-65]
MCDHRREREERLKATPANEDGAVESREVNGQAAVKRLQTSFVESGVSAALLRYLSDTGPLLLQDSWDLPRSNDDAEAARQQLKAANSDAQAMADKRCDALRHACEQLGQEVERMEELHVDDQLSALSIELAVLEEAEAALQQAEEAAGQATCSAQGEGSEGVVWVAEGWGGIGQRVPGGKCRKGKNVMAAEAGLGIWRRIDEAEEAVGCTRAEWLSVSGQLLLLAPSSTLYPAAHTHVPSLCPSLPLFIAHHQAAQVAALTRVKAELAASLQRCAAAEGLSSHLAAAAAATQASEEQSHPAERHTRSAGPPLTREAAASGSAAARACAPATGKAGLPAVVLGGAGEGSMGEGSSATVEVAVLRGGHVAAASIVPVPMRPVPPPPHVRCTPLSSRPHAITPLPVRRSLPTLQEAPGLPQRSLPLQPSTHAADSATGANQQHPGGAGVPVAAAVAEAACLLRLLALRRAHMANALATAPFPPRYMVEMAGEGAFKVKWANGATLTLTACNDWPMPGGHLAVADVELPHTAQSGEERQQLLSLLSTAVPWQGDAQRQDDTPPAPPALSALGGVIAAAGACLRKAMMVALKTS